MCEGIRVRLQSLPVAERVLPAFASLICHGVCERRNLVEIRRFPSRRSSCREQIG